MLPIAKSSEDARCAERGKRPRSVRDRQKASLSLAPYRLPRHATTLASHHAASTRSALPSATVRACESHHHLVAQRIHDRLETAHSAGAIIMCSPSSCQRCTRKVSRLRTVAAPQRRREIGAANADARARRATICPIACKTRRRVDCARLVRRIRQGNLWRAPANRCARATLHGAE
jgi:hypothetical protein